MGDMAKRPISQILLLLLVVAVVLQFQALYFKNRKRYGLKFCTQVGSNNQMCSDLSKYL